MTVISGVSAYMRSSNTGDQWRRIYLREYDLFLKDIQLNGLIGLQTIGLNKGLSVICGLNGAGKSTILYGIKSVLGMPLALHENRKIVGSEINATVEKGGAAINCQNLEGQHALDLGIAPEEISYIDYYSVTKALGYLFKNATSDDEFIDGIQPVQLNEIELRDISCIVGKQYEACTFYELDEVVFEDEPLLLPITIPFFKVRSYDIEYSSIEMGIGEHFLFYVFWLLKRAEDNSIVIIEEPETFISIKAQVELMNYIAFCCNKSGISVVITTHSPYILDRVDNQHIRVINRHGKNVSIVVPTDENPATVLLGMPAYLNKGVIYVEDEVAKIFLLTLLAEEAPLILDTFRIISVSGESEITRRLKFPKDIEMDYKLIGIYDGDMQSNKLKLGNQINWPFLFLPVSTCVEGEILDAFRNKRFIDDFIQELGMRSERILPVLAKIEGEDHHDWFIDLCKGIHSEYNTMIRAFYSLWIAAPDKQVKVKSFIDELKKNI